jgi:hypothetical protein
MAKIGKTYRISRETAEFFGISEEVTEEQLQQWIAESRSAPEDVPEPPPEELVRLVQLVRSDPQAQDPRKAAHANRP